MLFLIKYDRAGGTVVTMQTFADHQRAEAEETRLRMELAQRRHDTRFEVALLEAATEDALRLTHRRYFEDLPALARVSESRSTT